MSFCTSAAVAASTISGVGASTTTMIESNCGKAFSKRISRCRPGLADEISWLISVVIAKCVTEYQEAASVKTIAAAMTHQAKCTQKPIVRTTKEESAFMG